MCIHAQYKHTHININIVIIHIYTITWLLCVFSLVVNRDLLKDTQMTSNTRQRTSFSFFMPQNHSTNHLNFYCRKQIDNIFPYVCTVIDCNRPQKMSQYLLQTLKHLVYSYFNKRCPQEAYAYATRPKGSMGRHGNLIVGRLAMASEYMKVCLRMLKKVNKSRYDTYAVKDVPLC